jgi:hypothetical protein
VASSLQALELPADYSAEKDPALEEIVPEGVTPDPEQRAIILETVPHTYLTRVKYGPRGQVTNLYLSNHGAKGNKKEIVEKYGEQHAESRIGIDAALLAQYAAFTDLEEIIMLHQDPAAEGFNAVEHWPNLLVFRIENIDQSEFMPKLNTLQKLKWLELKHLFGLDTTHVQELGTFPQLVRLELDNRSAQEEALGFLKKNPTVLDFELHRSGLNNDQIGEIVDALPNLQRLALKPRGKAFDAAALEHVKRLPDLRVFGFHQWKEDMFFWENGLQHLVDAPSLEFIEVAGGHRDHPAVRKLLEARPDIKMADGLERVVLTDYGID